MWINDISSDLRISKARWDFKFSEDAEKDFLKAFKGLGTLCERDSALVSDLVEFLAFFGVLYFELSLKEQ